MLSFRDMCERRCVEDLIHVIQQVPIQAGGTSPIDLDDSSLAMVVFWTLLRWERKFWLVCLEELGVDMLGADVSLTSCWKRRRQCPQPTVQRTRPPNHRWPGFDSGSTRSLTPFWIGRHNRRRPWDTAISAANTCC